jgi:uncharacterized protein (DUF58 family)
MSADAPFRLRREAEALTHDASGVLMEARHLAAAAPGAHGRRQAGPGEAFWQFRDHRVEDGVRLVDWRRSARGERLFVREREREGAQNAQIWLDGHPGFSWRGGADRPLKRDRAAALCLAAALLLWRGGERAGALGSGLSRGGPEGAERLLDRLLSQRGEPVTPIARAGVVLASDGYAPIETWRARLETCVAAGAFGVVALIADPAEEDFPFAGRVEFQAPEGGGSTTFGRAEDAQAAYRARLSAHVQAIAELAGQAGFALVRHRTDRAPGPALSAVIAGLERRR